MKKILFVLFVFLLTSKLLSQYATAVPFLLVKPSARVNGLAGSFTAVANDANAMFYNPAGLSSVKYGSFEYSRYEFFANHPDPNIRFMSASFAVPDVGFFGIDLTYMYLGEHVETDLIGNETAKYNSKEWALSLGYSRKLSKYTSLGASFKIIRSELVTAIGPKFGLEKNTGYAFDLGVLFNNFLSNLCYKKRFLDFKYQEYMQHRTFSGPSIGLAIKNIGPHMTYISEPKDPLPQQLRIGAAWNIVDTDVISLMISSDLRKLLVKRDREDSDQFYQAWFISWKDFSLNRFKFSAGIEVTLFYMFSLRVGRYLESDKDGGHDYWAHGFSFGPETLRLNGYYTEHDNDYYGDTRWHLGLSVVY